MGRHGNNAGSLLFALFQSYSRIWKKSDFCDFCVRIMDLSLSELTSSDSDSSPLRDWQARSLAYLSRLKLLTVKAFKAKIRYAAYSSDVGEAARPVVSNKVILAAYGVAGTYVLADVGYECYKKKNTENLEWSDWGVVRTGLHATLFQGIASLAIPTALIHTGVGQSSKMFAKYGPRYLKWGPSVVGLCMIPMMPFFDEPVEHGVDWFFENYVTKEERKFITENPEVVRGTKRKND
ncbi:hypothetical protein TrVE_jg5237 [Triparma verrucosa]|uniref:Mitochondrial fission process protein 1 n=1 Tax=Triparma verrucosa TaxID=1606542 RepID=A0A9W7EJY0_9STRA|nr:hypothetical protein TrVE_jg5237 [Triparma verrucosa]